MTLAGGPPPASSEEASAHIALSRLRVARVSRVREIIFGAQDGLLTTLGLVSGVGGATGDRYTVLVAGAAGAFAGMIAMGAGAYISSKSQQEVLEAEIEVERNELARNPERELEELVQLFRDEGLPEDDARLVAEKIAARPNAMLAAMTRMELGLQIGPGEPLREGGVMAAAFAIGAAVPIVPWLLLPTVRVASMVGLVVSPALAVSVGVTMLTLFIMGAGKARVARSSVLRGGLEIMGIGFAAAVVGYILGSIFPHLVGARPGVGG
ncbi:MAG: VIT1/CCC1 transporter family protein [Candidatus Dormibacteraeota bacterium]|nr:VIT1/CCC1 transporter family protein [Candidatus Dormibacteraeota bacterium]